MALNARILKIYRGSNAELPFVRWIKGLRDIKGKQAIEARIDRLRLGNFGDHRSVGGGVTELRIHKGPGYRVYLGQDGNTLVILLCGGDKGTQHEDIRKAKTYWQDYQKKKAHAVC